MKVTFIKDLEKKNKRGEGSYKFRMVTVFKNLIGKKKKQSSNPISLDSTKAYRGANSVTSSKSILDLYKTKSLNNLSNHKSHISQITKLTESI